MRRKRHYQIIIPSVFVRHANTICGNSIKVTELFNYGVMEDITNCKTLESRNVSFKVDGLSNIVRGQVATREGTTSNKDKIRLGATCFKGHIIAFR